MEQLYDADADTWTKALAIGKYVAANIPHDNQEIEPEHRNAIDLWEYTKNIEPAFNCRLHSLLTFELLLAAGLDARYVTCMPGDEEDTECHVMNEVWLPELGKWAMIDTDMDGNYASDLNGTPLSLREIREHYISGEKMQYHPRFKKATTKVNEHYSYMAKNTYWFDCWENLSYFQEDWPNRQHEIGRKIYLVPSGFYRIRNSRRNNCHNGCRRFLGATGEGGLINSNLSVKPVDKGLYLEQPFDEREVRDPEGVVYYRGII